ncbi:MAG TPA: hypothetical protein EYG78_07190 [Sulfurovum sp.]|nr:hypothetical protein [Sulfurovum sp.]
MTKTPQAQFNSLKNIRTAYEEIAELYDMRKIEIERIFHETLAEFYKTENFYFSGDGIQINGYYKTVPKWEFKKLYGLFIENIKKERNSTILRYIKDLVDANDGVLYCEMGSYVSQNQVYILKPLLSKEKRLKYMILTVKLKTDRDGNHVVFPKGLKRIPVYIESVKRNKNAKSDLHAVIARGTLMNKVLAQKHLDILNRRFMKNYNVDLGLEVVQSYLKGLKLEYKSSYTLPLDAIKIIGNYFRSFNVQSYIKQDS